MDFEKLYGREAYRCVDEGGDDLDATLNRAEDGWRMLAVMRKKNFKASVIKQMVAKKSEFFRNTITTDGVYASPVRALTTFVNGKWEGTGQVPIKERVTAILDQVAKMQRRGVDDHFCNILAVICLSHWCKINTGDEWLDLPKAVIHGRVEDGGFGVPDSTGCVWKLADHVPEPEVVGKLESPPGSLVTRDWLHVMARDVRALNLDLEVSDAKIAELAAASFDVYTKYDYSRVMAFRTDVLERVPAVEARINEAAWSDLEDYIALGERETVAGRILKYKELMPYITLNGKNLTRDQLGQVFDVGANLEVLDFKGDIYYRRLISEPLAKMITEFCMEIVAQDVVDLGAAEEIFKDLCWMMFKNPEFRL